jgi:hypothetical protein
MSRVSAEEPFHRFQCHVINGLLPSTNQYFSWCKEPFPD